LENITEHVPLQERKILALPLLIVCICSFLIAEAETIPRIVLLKQGLSSRPARALVPTCLIVASVLHVLVEVPFMVRRIHHIYEIWHFFLSKLRSSTRADSLAHVIA